MRFSLLLLLLPGALQILGADPGKGRELQPGLVAEYRTLTENSEVLPCGESTQSRPLLGAIRLLTRVCLPGSFTVTWTGRIDVDGDEELRFGAFLAGNLQVTVDGEDVLRWSYRGKEAWYESPKGLSRAAGTYPIRIVFSSIADSAARLQLGWSGKSFSQEPIPASRFTHPAAEFSEEWRFDAKSELGRVIIGQLGCAHRHREALPGFDAPPPCPSLIGLGDRVSKEWLQTWLENPRYFCSACAHALLIRLWPWGFVERALLADYLLGELRSDEMVRNRQGTIEEAGKVLSVWVTTCHTCPTAGSRRPG